ncbi:MAG: response regulator [Cyanobacteria bacterium P01_G01_bin.38]
MATIYVIEDCLSTQNLIMDILQANGALCLGCRRVDEALKTMPVAPPDLIILEPLTDQRRGFKFFHEVRQNPKTEYVPIVLITAASKASVRDLLETTGGPTLYRSKPYDPNELVAIAQAL